MLVVQEVQKSFGGLKAVDDCTLQVREGSITGLIGPNGAGKTTLFNLITGFYKPDGGTINFEGERIEGLSPDRIFHKKMFRTFQITREFERMTVLENLMIVPAGQIGEKVWNTWLRSNKVKEQEMAIKEQATDVLDFVELTHLKNEYAGTLSGGQKKLLELAKCLMAEPKMVLLDEPGAGVNPTLMNKLSDHIRKLCEERGMTFFLIEHDMEAIASVCERVMFMDAGKKIYEGTPEEVCNDPRVIEAYLE